jgi:uncharacterized protein YejL (UPF0352 family)
MEKIKVDLTEVELILEECTDWLRQLRGMDLMTLLAVLGPFVASVIIMNTEDGRAQAVAEQFGTDLRSVVDHMIKDGGNLSKAGLRGN